MPDDELLSGLNPAQREAVTHRQGPLLIVAGAGTGKTRVLVHRMAWLIREGLAKPDQILALAFNEKAALELEERVDLLVPYGQAPTGVMTFHSLGQRLLEEHGLRLGLSGPGRVLSGAAAHQHLKSRLWDLPLKRFRPLGNPDKHVADLARAFSRAKDEDVDPEAWLAAAQALQADAGTQELKDEAAEQLELAAAYQAYQACLRADGFLDHGDQLLLALKLLRDHPAVLKRVREAWPAVLVDEYQDLNTAQSRLIRLLCPPEAAPLLTVVGDDDQAIYGFRGASLAALLGFRDDYPGARVVALNQNYRSRQGILDAAYRLIRHNDPERLEVKLEISKQLQAERGASPEAVELRPFKDQATEASFVTDEIKAGLERGLGLKDHAVLVRSHAMGQKVVDELARQGIAARYPGEKGLYRQPEVRRALAFVRALASPEDDLAVFDLLVHAPQPWDLLQIKHLLGAAQHQNLALWRALGREDLLREVGLGREALAQGEAWLTELRSLGALAARQGVAAALYAHLQRSGVLAGLLKQADGDSERQLANLARFFERLKDFDLVERAGNVPAVAGYLDSLIESGDDPATEQAGPDEDAVTVSTVHQAKGLEWPVVFLVGLEDQHFPMAAKAEPLHLPASLCPPPEDRRLQAKAEERRLFYVALTRAMDKAWLSHSMDQGGVKAWKRSPFVSEALGIAPEAKAPAKLEARQRLARFEAHPHPLHQPLPSKVGEDGILRLTYYPVDDYLTCPFKYKISHVLGLKPPPDQALMYGNAFHHAVQAYHRARMEGLAFGFSELVQAFETVWDSAGFDSKEHEQQRLAKAMDQLRLFYEEEEASGLMPWRIEHDFDAPLDPHTRLVGRMDRVDRLAAGEVVISDYKTSGKDTEEKAEAEVKKSLQLAIYALAYQAETGRLPDKLELRFLETGLRASLAPDQAYMDKKKAEILGAAEGIRAGRYEARPQAFKCSYCAYAPLCPHAER